MLGYLDAKPKVGYFPGPVLTSRQSQVPSFVDRPVRDVMGVPVVLRDTATVSDAVVTMFLENVGSIAVADEWGALVGIVSRKDLLKVTLGNAQAASVLLGMVMTRYPNVVTVKPDDTVMEALRKLIVHQVDGLPVVQPLKSAEADNRFETVGRFTKTTIAKLLYAAAVEED
jgi:predicted transcriptional regulator